MCSQFTVHCWKHHTHNVNIIFNWTNFVDVRFCFCIYICWCWCCCCSFFNHFICLVIGPTPFVVACPSKNNFLVVALTFFFTPHFQSINVEKRKIIHKNSIQCFDNRPIFRSQFLCWRSMVNIATCSVFTYLSAAVFNANGNCFVAIVDYRLLVLNAQLSQFNRSNSSVQCPVSSTCTYLFTLLSIPVSLFCFVHHHSFHLDSAAIINGLFQLFQMFSNRFHAKFNVNRSV